MIEANVDRAAEAKKRKRSCSEGGVIKPVQLSKLYLEDKGHRDTIGHLKRAKRRRSFSAAVRLLS